MICLNLNLFIAKESKTSPVKAAVNLFLLSAGIIFMLWYSLSKIGIVLDFSFLPEIQGRLAEGFRMTIRLSLASLGLSLILGMACAVFQSSGVLILRYLAKLYVAFIRGTPLIMQIYLFFYIIGTAFGIENRFISGVLILSVFEGAYIAEILRGSMLSIEASQLEAAKAVGFTKQQTFLYVILPQLTARTLPALTGQFASIIKDSSLLSIIAVIELTQTMREITSFNFKLFECYFLLGILYLCLTLPLTLISKRFERRYRFEN